MARHTEVRILVPGASPAADRAVRELIDATSHAVAAADQAYVLDAVGRVGRERRGLIRRRTRRPRHRPASS
jgi:hypothetical protein